MTTNIPTAPVIRTHKEINYATSWWLFRITAITFVALTIFTASLRDSYFRYAIYLFPAIFFVEWLVNGHIPKRFDRDARLYVFLMGLALLYPAAVGPDKSIALAIFMFLPYLALLVPVRMPFSTILWLFVILSLGQIALSVYGGFSFSKLMEMSFDKHTLEQETHTIPFVLGLLLGPVLFKRHYALFCLGLFCLILGEKRIAVMGAMLGIACHYGVMKCMPFLMRKLERTRFVLFLMIALCTVVTIYMPEIFRAYALENGLNVNIFTSGRFDGQSYAYDHLLKGGMLPSLFGHGLGQADAWAAIGWNLPSIEIHNDYLRIVIDMGLALGALFQFCLIALVARGRYAFYLMPYMAVLWFTDNTLTYAFYSAALVLLLMEQREPTSVNQPLKQA